MASTPPRSHQTPTGWTGATDLIQKWLKRRSGAESMLNLGGGVFFLLFGLVAMIVTSAVGTGAAFFVLFATSTFLSAVGIHVALTTPLSFFVLFVIFLALTIRHAYVTRKGVDGPLTVDLDLSLGLGLFLEFVSSGPIMLLLAVQEFRRYYRLTHMDIPHVSALLLWVYDKDGRVSFAEICMAFPELNAVRVLPQLRDLPGINWWPEDAELSLSDELMTAFAKILRREPKESAYNFYQREERPRAEKHVAGVDQEIASWYATLNLPLFANLQEVKKSYRKLAKIHHPDVQSGGRKTGDDQMKRINEAYHNILRHSQSKAGPAA